MSSRALSPILSVENTGFTGTVSSRVDAAGAATPHSEQPRRHGATGDGGANRGGDWRETTTSPAVNLWCVPKLRDLFEDFVIFAINFNLAFVY